MFGCDEIQSNAPKIAADEKRVLLREFLNARNPLLQMSTAFESYIIKPVQRVLKYPLIIRELK